MNSEKVLNSLLEVKKVFLNEVKILGQGVELFHFFLSLLGREIQSGSLFLTFIIRIFWTAYIFLAQTYIENEAVSWN